MQFLALIGGIVVASLVVIGAFVVAKSLLNVYKDEQNK